MASLDNGSSTPSRCSKVECYIDSFTVTIDAETDVANVSMTDTCNQMVSPRMFKAVVSAALVEWAEDVSLDLPADTCRTNCCDGLPGVDYVFGSLTASYALTGIVAAAAADYEVFPPFHSVV